MKSKLIILGCGSSVGVPRIDGAWGRCDKNNKKNKRTRCSAIIIKGSNSILIDTSPDLRTQLLANKIKDIRAAVCYNPKSTRLSRQHNDANIIALGARLTKKSLSLKLVETFLKTSFEGGRHLKRIKKI